MRRVNLMGRLGAILLLVAACDMRAALNINTDTVQKAVVFLYGSDAAGNADPDKALGTGFFLRVPVTSEPTKFYILLATARHIFDPQWAHCPESNPTVLFARLNKTGYTAGSSEAGTIFVRLDILSKGQPLWHHPSDERADAAAMLIMKPDVLLKDVDGETIPLSDLPSENEVKSIGVGDQIVSAGLVPGFTGKNRNRPFFKFGYISSTSDEDVDTRCSLQGASYPIRGWFVAANLVPGNSGSPIFFVPPGGGGVSFGSPVTRAVLLGIQSSSILPADLAVMTPSNYLYEAVRLLPLPNADLQIGPPKR